MEDIYAEKRALCSAGCPMDIVRVKEGRFGEGLYWASVLDSTRFSMGWNKRWKHVSARSLTVSFREKASFIWLGLKKGIGYNM